MCGSESMPPLMGMGAVTRMIPLMLAVVGRALIWCGRAGNSSDGEATLHILQKVVDADLPVGLAARRAPWSKVLRQRLLHG